MTTTFTVAGGIGEGLTHFAAAGLAEILVDAGERPVRWGWIDGTPARAVVESPVSVQRIGEIVSAHARVHAEPGSWVQAALDGRRGVLSPRVAAPKSREAWVAQEQVRRGALDRISPGSQLDHRFVAALGRPAYWNVDTATPNPDAGASRWEMKTRNRGETFVGERLAPLADIVAARDGQSILDGLSGVALVDEAGKGKADSRTATGLVSPRPVDNAVAWCALWGLSASMVWWRPTGVAPTVAVGKVGATHPTMAVLPVFTTTVTPARYRGVLRSAAWAGLCAGLMEHPDGVGSLPVEVLTGVTSMGVDICVVFHIEKAGSDSAPERYLTGGALMDLHAGSTGSGW